MEPLHFIDENGNEISSSAWHGQPVVLVFLRWLG
jgi:cytochrome oxidase Cu insertion factor (SCO1/SenC/PrrC family)